MLLRDKHILNLLNVEERYLLYKILRRTEVMPLRWILRHHRTPKLPKKPNTEIFYQLLSEFHATMADILHILITSADKSPTSQDLLHKILRQLYPTTIGVIPGSSVPGLHRRVIKVNQKLLPNGVSSSTYLPGQTVGDLIITLGLSYDQILEHEELGALILSPLSPAAKPR